jgi:hypothetical protein
MTDRHPPDREYSTEQLRDMALERRRELYEQWLEAVHGAKALWALAPRDYVCTEDMLDEWVQWWVNEEGGSVPGFTGGARDLVVALRPLMSRIAHTIAGTFRSLHALEEIGDVLAEDVIGVSDVLEPDLPVRISYERGKLERRRTHVRNEIHQAYFDLREAIGTAVPDEPLKLFRERVEEIAEAAISGNGGL